MPVYALLLISKFLVRGGPFCSLHCLVCKHPPPLQTISSARTPCQPTFLILPSAGSTSLLEHNVFPANISRAHRAPPLCTPTFCFKHPHPRTQSLPLHMQTLFVAHQLSPSCTFNSPLYINPLKFSPLYPGLPLLHILCYLHSHPQGWCQWDPCVSCRPDISRNTASQDSQS